MREIELSGHDFSLALRPAGGGGVTRLSWRGLPILRPTPAGDANPAALAAFVMAPFANRIAHARFAFAGRTHMLPADPAGAPHALHGQAWRSEWTVDEIGADLVRLSMSGGAPWPWPFRVRQTIRLAAGHVDVALALTNLAEEPMPASLGWHPAFARRLGARLQLQADAYLPTRDDLPLAPAPLPERWRFAGGVAGAAVAPIDHCLTGWDGRVRVEWADMIATLTADGCRFLQVYAPADADFICIEPQTSAPDALNRPAQFGAAALAPDATLHVPIRLDVAAPDV